MVEGRAGRPRALVKKDRRYVSLSADLARKVEDLADAERRTFAAQLEVLIERGLLACGLEVSAA